MFVIHCVYDIVYMYHPTDTSYAGNSVWHAWKKSSQQFEISRHSSRKHIQHFLLFKFAFLLHLKNIEKLIKAWYFKFPSFNVNCLAGCSKIWVQSSATSFNFQCSQGLAYWNILSGISMKHHYMFQMFFNPQLCQIIKLHLPDHTLLGHLEKWNTYFKFSCIIFKPVIALCPFSWFCWIK